MSLIDRSDLRFDYSWASGRKNPRNNPQTEKDNRSRLFRRDEGEDVLSFINEYASEHEITTKKEALRIETLLREELDEEDMSRDEVKVWVDDLIKGHEGTGPL